MTKDQYDDFRLRYKGCGAALPMFIYLSRFEKMWFTAIQKDIASLEAENKKLRDSLKSDKICTCSTYLNFKDLEDELDRADKLLQRVIEWSEWQGSGCPRFNDIKDDIKAFLEEAHHD